MEATPESSSSSSRPVYDCPVCGPVAESPDAHAGRHAGSAGLLGADGAPLAPAPPAIGSELELELEKPDPAELELEHAGHDLTAELFVPLEVLEVIAGAAGLFAALLVTPGVVVVPHELVGLVDDFKATVHPHELASILETIRRSIAHAQAMLVLSEHDGILRSSPGVYAEPTSSSSSTN